jgi:peptidyl-prolyl cis-trans isomerase SDCCAG10
MANSGKDSNNSQFFITFDSCNYLDYKHTIFGKVVGETIYNLINIQDAEVDENNRPIEPIFILST